MLCLLPRTAAIITTGKQDRSFFFSNSRSFSGSGSGRRVAAASPAKPGVWAFDRAAVSEESIAPISSSSNSSSTMINAILPYLQNASQAATRKLEELAARGGLEEFLRGSGGFPANLLVTITLLCLTFLIVSKTLSSKRRSKKNLPPEIPGFPFVGNLLQMTTERPHKQFTTWSEKYGPIYLIKTGQTRQVIISSPELAKEALVTKYASICNRSLGTNITILSRKKQIVAIADYGERYRVMKKMVVNNLLGQNTQKSLRYLREIYLNKSLDALFDELKQFADSTGLVNARDTIINILFPLGMHQVFGRDVDELFVPEIGKLGRWDLHAILVQELMKGAVAIDWRDFFPSLSWIPNKKLEQDLKNTEHRRSSVTQALIQQQKELLSKKAKADCYCDVLLENESQFNEDEFLLAVWEPIIESSDTTVVTSEWAMYELASNPELQEKLYNEIKQVVGDNMVTEDDLPNLPYLNAVVKETLRKHAPVPILPPRYIHEEVQLGDYTIPAGYQMIVNVHGIHHDKKTWKNPEAWDPSRFTGKDDKFDMGVSDMRVMPFGGGKRLCAGIPQVFYVVPMIIAALVQHFSWSLADDSPEQRSSLEETVYLTAQKLFPLEAVAKPRVPSRLKVNGAQNRPTACTRTAASS